MIHLKENQTTWLSYVAMITKLLATFNIDTMDEDVDSTNHRITYIAPRDIKVLVKHGVLQNDPIINEEEDPKEVEDTKIDKVLQIC